MNIINELSQRNTYIPNLSNSQESCERTYKEAEAFFEMVQIYLEKLEREIEFLSDKNIYDKCNPIASNLALCCELFLKAIYIHEHSLSGDNINDIWETLSRKDKIVYDKFNNPVYQINGVVVHLRYDATGNTILDENGNKTYIDENGNILKQGAQGKKLQKSGHDLEYIITSVISPESKLLLEVMMKANSIDETIQHKKVDFLDILASKNIIPLSQKISDTQYSEWLSQHRETFVDARYAGQQLPNVEIAFLYHLATHCKALAQFIIKQNPKQLITLSDEEIQKIVEICKDNGIKITGSMFKSTLEEVQKKIKFCKENCIEPNDLIFLSSDEKFKQTIDFCKQNKIDFDGHLLAMRMDMLKKKKELFELLNINYTAKTFIISIDEIMERYKICRLNGINCTNEMLFMRKQKFYELFGGAQGNAPKPVRR